MNYEQGFRWMRETISLIYAHHRHPVPMTAMIFLYSETLGKGLAFLENNKNPKTNEKVSGFVSKYMPKLWKAMENFTDKENILANYYRNGLIHQMFMKNNVGIHEDANGITEYVYKSSDVPCSINIDRLVPEFLDGIAAYYSALCSDKTFLNAFNEAMSSE